MRLTKLILASLLFTGCAAQLQTTQINPAPATMMQARTPDQVDVFASGPPTRAHIDVALIQARPGIDERSTGALIARMRAQAAAMGCDGVVINQVNDQITHKGDDITTITGTCIAYTGPDPTALTAAGD